MSFGHKAKPCQVFKYGIKPNKHHQIINLPMVENEMYQMFRYYNMLVKIERARRRVSDRIVHEAYPLLSDAKAVAEQLKVEVEAAEAEAAALNAQARRRRVTQEERESLRRLKRLKKEAWDRHKEMKAAAYDDPYVKSQLAATEAQNKRMQITARHRPRYGLQAGNYLAVESDASSMNKGAPPKYKRWSRNGRIQVQLEKTTVPTRDIFDHHRKYRLQIDPPPCLADFEWGHRSGCRTVCRIRIGAENTRRRGPVWAEFPVTIHRPLPDNAHVKWASIIRRRVGTHDRWSLQLTVERISGFNKPDRAETGMVGVDVGWRVRPHGLRVAYWYGSDGQQGELVIPNSDRARWDKTEDLQSIRDQQFNNVIDIFASWFAGESVPAGVLQRIHWLQNECARWENTYRNRGGDRRSEVHLTNLRAELSAWVGYNANIQPAGRTLTPQWLMDRITNSEGTSLIRSWRATPRNGETRVKHAKQAKLASIVLQWRDNRFPGDELIFNLLEQWRKRDKHLYEWEANQRRKSLAWRKDFYRNFAAFLRRRYEMAAVEDCNWAKFKEKKSVEYASTKDDVARMNMHSTAAGDLLETIAQSMAVSYEPTAQTTMICSNCGQLTGEEDTANLMHTCNACGQVMDQDENAARNLLRSLTVNRPLRFIGPMPLPAQTPQVVAVEPPVEPPIESQEDGEQAAA